MVSLGSAELLSEFLIQYDFGQGHRSMIWLMVTLLYCYGIATATGAPPPSRARNVILSTYVNESLAAFAVPVYLLKL